MTLSHSYGWPEHLDMSYNRSHVCSKTLHYVAYRYVVTSTERRWLWFHPCWFVFLSKLRKTHWRIFMKFPWCQNHCPLSKKLWIRINDPECRPCSDYQMEMKPQTAKSFLKNLMTSLSILATHYLNISLVWTCILCIAREINRRKLFFFPAWMYQE